MFTITCKARFSEKDSYTRIESKQDAVDYINAMYSHFGDTDIQYYEVSISDHDKYHLLAKINIDYSFFDKSNYDNLISREQLMMILLVYVDAWHKVDFVSIYNEYQEAGISRFMTQDQENELRAKKLVTFKRGCFMAVLHYFVNCDLNSVSQSLQLLRHIIDDRTMTDLQLKHQELYRRNKIFRNSYDHKKYRRYRINRLAIGIGNY